MARLTTIANPDADAPANAMKVPVTARTRMAMGSFAFEGEASITPVGLLAVGGMVSLVLLSVAPIILSAAVARRARIKPAPALPKQAQPLQSPED